MAINQWFKLYGGEYLSDPKIASLSAQERSCWITLLCLASISSTPGIIEYLTVESLLKKSGVEPDEWGETLTVLDKFSEMKMIVTRVTNSNATSKSSVTVEVINWKKRQERILTNAERQAKYRDKRRNERVTGAVTEVTLDKIRIDKRDYTSAPPEASPLPSSFGVVIEPEDLEAEEVDDTGAPLVRKKPKTPRTGRHVEIAKAYMKRKKLEFKNDAAYARELHRNMKAASDLLDYTGDEILTAIKFCEEKYGDMWTLETVVKKISEALTVK